MSREVFLGALVVLGVSFLTSAVVFLGHFPLLVSAVLYSVSFWFAWYWGGVVGKGDRRNEPKAQAGPRS